MTGINRPGTPSLIAPGSATVGSRFLVQVGSICPAGTSKAYNIGNNKSGTKHLGSFYDTWGSVFTVQYYAQVRCYTASTTSAWSNVKYDSTRTPPSRLGAFS